MPALGSAHAGLLQSIVGFAGANRP